MKHSQRGPLGGVVQLHEVWNSAHQSLWEDFCANQNGAFDAFGSSEMEGSVAMSLISVIQWFSSRVQERGHIWLTHSADLFLVNKGFYKGEQFYVFKISGGLCSHKFDLAKVWPWRHFPLNHLDCSNPCRPPLAATTTFPCGLFRMWFKSLQFGWDLQCGCDILWLSPQHWGNSTKRYPRTLPQALQLRHHWFALTISDSRSQSAKLEQLLLCRCQPVTTVRGPSSSQFPSSSKSLINEGCVSCANVESRESLSLADTSNLVLGRTLVADSAVIRFPGILSLPGIMLPVPVRARMSRTLNNFCHAGKI